jgi:hypothetical protein
MLIIWLCLKEQGKRFRERWMRTGRSLHCTSHATIAPFHTRPACALDQKAAWSMSSSHVMREQIAARGGVAIGRIGI